MMLGGSGGGRWGGLGWGGRLQLDDLHVANLTLPQH